MRNASEGGLLHEKSSGSRLLLPLPQNAKKKIKPVLCKLVLLHSRVSTIDVYQGHMRLSSACEN